MQTTMTKQTQANKEIAAMFVREGSCDTLRTVDETDLLARKVLKLLGYSDKQVRQMFHAIA